MKYSIALFITATGKYTKFLPKLIDTAEKYFLPSINKTYYIFTDNSDACDVGIVGKSISVAFIKTPHRQWPESTMLRSQDYWMFLSDIKEFPATHAFAIDADTRFASEIKPEDILADSVGVQHCRYVNETGEYETNPNSACFVPKDKALIYYGGGFYGGSIQQFIEINRWMTLNVQWNTKTLKQDIIPRWHDESALNKYFFLHPPTLTLSPAYHWPEYGNDGQLNPFIEGLWDQQKEYLLTNFNQQVPIHPKIILIDKNRGKSEAANELRSAQ